MNERRSLQLLAEQYSHVQTNQILRDAFEKDLKAFEQYLVREGLWDTVKQKGSQLVGGAKNALIQPLIKMVLDKLAQSDPEGYKKLQAAANDPAQLQALLNSPEVQQQQQSLGQDIATTAEGLDEELYNEYLNEVYSYLVTDAQQGPGATLNTGQHGSTAAYAAARGGKVAGPAPQQPSNAVKAIGKAGDAASWLGKKAASATQALGQTKAGQAVKSAAGGFIGKAVNWVKAHPKISLAAALGLIVATGGAAAIGAGGIAPLIATTLTAGGAGALKGGAIGAVAGGAKDIYNQVKGGDVKNLGDVKWGQAGKAALKTGVKGAAAGFAAGAGANILGKAALGAKDVISGNYGKAMKGFGPDNALKDLTPGEQRNLGVTNKQPTAPGEIKPQIDSPDVAGDVSNAGVTKAGFVSAAEVKKVTPDAQKIIDILLHPEKGADYGLKHWKRAPGMFTGDSAGYNASLNIKYDIDINGHSLGQILDDPLGEPVNMVLRRYQLMAAQDPEGAVHQLATTIAQELKKL